MQDRRAGDPSSGSNKSGAEDGRYGRDSPRAGAGVTQKPTPHENAYQGSELFPFSLDGSRRGKWPAPSPGLQVSVSRRPPRARPQASAATRPASARSLRPAELCPPPRLERASLGPAWRRLRPAARPPRQPVAAAAARAHKGGGLGGDETLARPPFTPAPARERRPSRPSR